MNQSKQKPEKVLGKGILFPYILLTALFFAWAIPNNLTDTMLAAFKRIMSLSDSKTAWIQVVCYLLGYGCCALPGALFIKRYSYKSGVLLGLAFYALGALLFFPAKVTSSINMEFSFYMYLFAIFILFAGLSILETSTNSYVLALGPESTATRRLNLSQSFNPFGAITGVVLSQIFILSQLNGLTATERAQLPAESLQRIQDGELNAVTTAYVILGFVMIAFFLAIYFTKMPNLSEGDRKVDLKATLKRLSHNKNYVWGVVAQFFDIGAQIAVWSFIIRYAMQQLNLDGVIAALGKNPSADMVCNALRNVEPVAASFYRICDAIGLDGLLPHTAEQAAATYYIMSLILFVCMRFVCTWLMRYFKAYKILLFMSLLAVGCCLGAIFGTGRFGVYCLMGISGCLSLMFPTIYGYGLKGLGDDTKIGGSGMVMSIAGAAILTQIQGIISDGTGSIMTAYIVPAVAFSVIAYYSYFIARKQEISQR
ncbi:L-fucose:H+ symporter permease [Prevotella sp. SGI.027]|nr:L-fucose:H+ symporter permease [Prevotellaceae bacterium]MDY3105090.1 L-fucose:H+ symporter permease [Prevotella sp.]MDY5843250.1 L-fucose:H+ symporter permease [Prevotella sp.]